MEGPEEKIDFNKEERKPISGQIGYEELLYSQRKEEEKDKAAVLKNQLTFESLINEINTNITIKKSKSAAIQNKNETSDFSTCETSLLNNKSKKKN